MDRRLFDKSLLTAPVLTAARAQEVASRTDGLPRLTIKDVQVITTSGGGNYGGVFLKII